MGIDRRGVGIALILAVLAVIASAILLSSLVHEERLDEIEIVKNEYPRSIRTYVPDMHTFSFAVSTAKAFAEVELRFSVLRRMKPHIYDAKSTQIPGATPDEIAAQIPLLKASLSAFPYGYRREIIRVEMNGSSYDAVLFDFGRMLHAAASLKERTSPPTNFLFWTDDIGNLVYYQGVSDFFLRGDRTIEKLVLGHNAATTRYGPEGDGSSDSAPLSMAPNLGTVAFRDVKAEDNISVIFRINSYSVPVNRELMQIIRIYGDGDLVAYEVNRIAGSGPAVIAHRGASGSAPENTLSAIRRALDMEANMIEIDVHTTKDGEIILMHDSDVSRTTNGSGLVSRLTSNQIDGLDAGSWFAPSFSDEEVPTLYEALEATKGRAILCIENKQAKPAAILEKVRNHDALDQVMVFDFNHARLYELKQLEDRARTLALGVSHEHLDSIDPNFVDAVGAPLSVVDEILVGRAHDMGMAVFTYTVNREGDMRKLVDLGVDGIITDYPSLALEVVNSTRVT